MSTKTYDARVRFKRDTQSNWENNNPILLSGELGIVCDEDGVVGMVVGDGSTRYSGLDLIAQQNEAVEMTTAEIDSIWSSVFGE